MNEWMNEWMDELTVDGWEDGQYVLWIEQIVYFLNTNLLERSVLLMIANGVVHLWLFWIFIIIFFYFKFNFTFSIVFFFIHPRIVFSAFSVVVWIHTSVQYPLKQLSSVSENPFIIKFTMPPPLTPITNHFISSHSHPYFSTSKKRISVIRFLWRFLWFLYDYITVNSRCINQLIVFPLAIFTTCSNSEIRIVKFVYRLKTWYKVYTQSVKCLIIDKINTQMETKIHNVQTKGEKKANQLIKFMIIIP